MTTMFTVHHDHHDQHDHHDRGDHDDNGDHEEVGSYMRKFDVVHKEVGGDIALNDES